MTVTNVAIVRYSYINPHCETRGFQKTLKVHANVVVNCRFPEVCRVVDWAGSLPRHQLLSRFDEGSQVLRFEARTANECAVDVGTAEQGLGVLGCHAAAVKNSGFSGGLEAKVV